MFILDSEWMVVCVSFAATLISSIILNFLRMSHFYRKKKKLNANTTLLNNMCCSCVTSKLAVDSYTHTHTNNHITQKYTKFKLPEELKSYQACITYIHTGSDGIVEAK